MNNEPVITAAVIAGVISAAIAMARILGWLPITDAQFEAVMAFVGLLLPVIFGVWARNHVTPTANPRAVNTEGKLVELSPTDGSILPE